MELATTRLVLREARPGDEDALAAYQCDPRYLEHYSTAPDAERIVSAMRAWAMVSPRENFQFIVTLCESGRVVGCAGLRRAGLPRGQADVGIELDPAHWGLGYAREALIALIAFARSELAVSHIIAETAPTNLRAHRLITALGFSRLSSDDDRAHFELPIVDADDLDT